MYEEDKGNGNARMDIDMKPEDLPEEYLRCTGKEDI